MNTSLKIVVDVTNVSKVDTISSSSVNLFNSEINKKLEEGYIIFSELSICNYECKLGGIIQAFTQQVCRLKNV